MGSHERCCRMLLVAALVLAGGCAIDERTGKALADALASGPVRAYASARADNLAETCLVLAQQVTASDNGAPDFASARSSWHKARAAYDRGVAVFVVVAPELDFELDGKMDDIFARSGLRPVEQALFAEPPAPALLRLTQELSDAAIALHARVPDPGRPLAAADLIGSMSAVAGQLAAKLDGSASPYAGASLLSVQSNLAGLAELYAILSPLVRGADPQLDQRLTAMLDELLAQVRALPSLEAVTDKPRYLRACAELARTLLQIGPALQLAVTTVNLS